MTLNDIQARCTDCEECDTRWSWAATLVRGVTPVMKDKTKTVLPRRALWEMKHGQPAPAGMPVITTCLNPLCCNPELLKAVSKAHVIKRTAATGVFSTLTFRAKVAQGKRKTSKLTDEAVASIRTSNEKPEVLAEKHGISKAYVHMLRKNRFRKEYTDNPFQGLMK